MILGGGNAGLEAARACLNKGAKNVYIVVRGSHENSLFTEEAFKKAEEEGVQFYFQSVVTRMAGEEKSLTQVEIVPISEQGEEESYRERELISVDTLLTGSGRFPELIYVPIEENGQTEEEEETSQKILVGWETPYPLSQPFCAGRHGYVSAGRSD